MRQRRKSWKSLEKGLWGADEEQIKRILEFIDPFIGGKEEESTYG